MLSSYSIGLDLFIAGVLEVLMILLGWNFLL